MKVRKKIVVCFSVTVFVVLLIASEVLVHGGTVQTTPARLQKISKNIWDIVEMIMKLQAVRQCRRKIRNHMKLEKEPSQRKLYRMMV